MQILRSDKGQAMAGPVQKLDDTAFAKRDNTAITWLGNASILINSRGTNLMIDPLLEGFDMPLLIEMPIAADAVPALDGVLITHIDNDHYSRPTTQKLKNLQPAFHAPEYVAGVMKEEGLDAQGHEIGDVFAIHNVSAKLTPADHAWQNGSQKWGWRHWEDKDYCGYWLETPDGTIWLPGDSRLLEEQLQMPQPDVILMDFADNDWHITLDGAVKMANTYPDAQLILIHWGSVDAPDWSTFNGDPEVFASRIVHPERVHALAPGEAFILQK